MSYDVALFWFLVLWFVMDRFNIYFRHPKAPPEPTVEQRSSEIRQRTASIIHHTRVKMGLPPEGKP